MAATALLAAGCLLQALPAAAHDLWTEPERFTPGSGQEMRPAVAHLVIGHSEQYRLPDDQYLLALVTNQEAVLAGIGAQPAGADLTPSIADYHRLRGLPPQELRKLIEARLEDYLDGVELEFDGRRVRPEIAGVKVPPVGDTEYSRRSTILLTGELPAGAREVSFRYAARYGGCVLHVDGSGRNDALWLKNGERAAPYVIGRGFKERTLVDVLRDYTVLGFTHILPKGLDHILFILGLFLLSARAKPLLVQVTMFTIAHTLTLGLSVYGVVSLPSAVVEPLIAASIAYVAVENILTPRLKPWRALVVFGFGLLHGLGFAGVLNEVGLPREQLLPALASFNVGVELGQVAVIALAFLAVGLWGRNRAWYRPRVVIPASTVIAAVSVFWTVQRMIGPY
ncbi:MAG: HupE/UreJ family protein [Pseudomonadota bacterium]